MDIQSKTTDKATTKAAELHPEAWKLRAAELLTDAAVTDRVTAITTAIDTVGQASKAADEGRGALWQAVRMVAEIAEADKMATSPADKASLFLALATERIEPALRAVADARKLKFAEYAKAYTETKSRAKAALQAGVSVTGKTLNAVKSELPKREATGAAAKAEPKADDTMPLNLLGPKAAAGIDALRALVAEVLLRYPHNDASPTSILARSSCGDVIGSMLIDLVAEARADMWPDKYGKAEAEAATVKRAGRAK